MSIAQKIAEIENEMARTQKNKATSYHVGIQKAKLAKLKRELIEGSGGKKGAAGNIKKMLRKSMIFLVKYEN